LRNFHFQTAYAYGQRVFHFPVTCCKCKAEEKLEFNKPASDAVVSAKLRRKGWLLARGRSDDICPTCMGVKPENQLASVFKVKNGIPAEAIVDQVITLRDQQTTTVLERLRTVPEETAWMSSDPHSLPSSPPALPSSEPASTSSPQKAIDTAEIVAAIELNTEQLSTLIALAKQQIEAIARIVPAVVRSNEALTATLQNLERGVARLEAAPPPKPEPKEVRIRNGLQTDIAMELLKHDIATPHGIATLVDAPYSSVSATLWMMLKAGSVTRDRRVWRLTEAGKWAAMALTRPPESAE
jgi:hypothetical protein